MNRTGYWRTVNFIYFSSWIDSWCNIDKIKVVGKRLWAKHMNANGLKCCEQHNSDNQSMEINQIEATRWATRSKRIKKNAALRIVWHSDNRFRFSFFYSSIDWEMYSTFHIIAVVVCVCIKLVLYGNYDRISPFDYYVYCTHTHKP